MSWINGNEFFLFQEIVKKDFAAKYKESVLGILWSILKPLFIMILLTIIFSTLFSPQIDNYPVYLLSARSLFSFFSVGTTAAMNSLKGNKNILKRTPAPKYIFVLGSVTSEFINFLITLIILVVVMIVTKCQFNFTTIPLAIIPIISLLMMIIGVGLILSIVCVYYSDIKHLWSIVTLMIMYASAIFYPMEIIPEPFHQFMILNPMFWIIDQFRNLVLWQTIPPLLNIVNSLLLSAIILVLGIIVFKKYEQKVTMKF